ncbi:MAG: response regulator transcription factor [Burkholderiaceae bacterium]|nr:response regulator transcription factor [Burkholderiaceae bacterium]
MIPRRVLIADDHQMVREGLRALLERAGHVVVAEAANGREAVDLAAAHRIEVAIVDLLMPILNGVDATRELTRVSPHTRTILLTMHADRPYVVEAMQAGAKGYVLKTQAGEDLVRAIEEVSRGALYVSPGVAVSLVDAILDKDESPASLLTPRERQILQLIAESKSTKQIARILGISYKTAESHRSRLMKKLDIHETAGLVRYAVRRGLVQL